ncbi:MAG: outer membrane beta-barrel protein [Bauldia sp.]|mgnify:CR=1 FL=1
MTQQEKFGPSGSTVGDAVKTVTIGLAGASTLALALATPAAAQQGVGNLFTAPARDPFNTFSIGIGGGYDIFNTSADVYSDSTVGSDGFSGDLRGHGGFGTVEIGRDFRFGSTVLGIYGDYSFGHKQDSIYNVIVGEVNPSNVDVAAAAPTAGPGEMVTSVGLRLGNSHAVIGRLGQIINPTTLVYGLFGYTWHNYNAWATVDDGNYGSLTSTRSGRLGGLTFGLGAEAMVSSNWSIKGEYRFVKLNGPGSFFDTAPQLDVGATIGKVNDHVFRGVISYKLP